MAFALFYRLLSEIAVSILLIPVLLAKQQTSTIPGPAGNDADLAAYGVGMDQETTVWLGERGRDVISWRCSQVIQIRNGYYVRVFGSSETWPKENASSSFISWHLLSKAILDGHGVWTSKAGMSSRGGCFNMFRRLVTSVYSVSCSFGCIDRLLMMVVLFNPLMSNYEGPYFVL